MDNIVRYANQIGKEEAQRQYIESLVQEEDCANCYRWGPSGRGDGQCGKTGSFTGGTDHCEWWIDKE